MSLEEVKSVINGYFDSFDSPVLERFKDDISFGKMLRSKLILAIAPHALHSIQLCAIIELVHFASLLHDDVIDNSTMRRGAKSINAIHGDKNAIMLGDLMYAKAFHEVSCINMELSKIISNAVVDLSLGELEDVFLSKNINKDSAKYLRMVEHKTAALIEASAMCAGVLVGEKSDKYKIYGNCIGIVYQIIDDLLDIVGEDSTLGKQSFSDFKEGKSTLPYIYLYENLAHDECAVLDSYFKKELDVAEKSWIRDKMKQHGIIKKVRILAHDYVKKALGVLDSGDVVLQKIAQDMIDREF